MRKPLNITATKLFELYLILVAASCGTALVAFIIHILE